MKFTVILAFIAAATAVSAASTNANRLARGLPPNPPARRGTPVRRDDHHGDHRDDHDDKDHKHKPHKPKPSTAPYKCHTGSAYCCNTVAKSGKNADIDSLLQTYQIDVPKGTMVGAHCSPLAVIGGAAKCSQQTVCCENNHFNSLIGLGCTPLNLNL